ncbi:hypothetical protein [Streptosporangium sp. NPDC051022]|uniref:hypothetical protein n=1 Tax=Streptosporangium sp. NPDC051022 TaxID=3155752 RepID=UPI003428C6BA
MTTTAPAVISPGIAAILDALTDDTGRLVGQARALADRLADDLADLHEDQANVEGDSPLSDAADTATELASVLDDLAERLHRPSLRQAETLL